MKAYQQTETPSSPGHGRHWQDESEGPSLHIHLQLQRETARALSTLALSASCTLSLSAPPPPFPSVTLYSRHAPLCSLSLSLSTSHPSRRSCVSSRPVSPCLGWQCCKVKVCFCTESFTARHTHSNPRVCSVCFFSLGEGAVINDMSCFEFDCRENTQTSLPFKWKIKRRVNYWDKQTPAQTKINQASEKRFAFQPSDKRRSILLSLRF